MPVLTEIELSDVLDFLEELKAERGYYVDYPHTSRGKDYIELCELIERLRAKQRKERQV